LSNFKDGGIETSQSSGGGNQVSAYAPVQQTGRFRGGAVRQRNRQLLLVRWRQRVRVTRYQSTGCFIGQLYR